MNIMNWLRHQFVITVVLLAGCLLWALWPVLIAMADRWSGDPRYAHGYLVPIFSLAWLRVRWTQMADVTMAPSAWGLLLLCLGVATQLGGGYYRLQSLEGLSVIPYLAGIALLVGGWSILRWAWPSIAFLGFMIPLPWRIETALGPPLQWMATKVSTYVLQTLGFTAYSEGFVIQVNDARIGVVEACSGLSMVLTFIALSTAMAMVVKRPLLDRILLVLSSIPVSLAANVFRITLTGILHEGVGGHAASTFYHDLAGWIMIPLALFLYWLEIWAFSHALVQTEHQGPLVAGFESQQQHLLKAQM